METQEERKPLTVGELLRRRGPKNPRPRAIRAVQIWAESGGEKSKGEALREAGYSDARANSPHKVFDSPNVAPYVAAIMAEAGIQITDVMRQLRRKVFSRRLDHQTFPTYNPQKAITDKVREEVEGLDLSEQIRGEQLTDEDIRNLLAEVGCTVRKIVHGEQARHVYYWTDNDKTQIAAIKQIVDIFGVEAPKKLDVKGNHTVGIFRLSDLRKKAQAEGVRIYEHQPNEQSNDKA